MLVLWTAHPRTQDSIGSGLGTYSRQDCKEYLLCDKHLGSISPSHPSHQSASLACIDMDTDSRADCLCMRRGETSCYPPYAAWCMDPEREECALPGSCSFSGHSEQDPFASYPCLFASQQSSGACVGTMLICGATLSRRNSYPGGLLFDHRKPKLAALSGLSLP